MASAEAARLERSPSSDIQPELIKPIPAPGVADKENSPASEQLRLVLDGVRGVWERHPEKLNDAVLANICADVSKNFDKPSVARFRIVKAEAPPGFKAATQYCYLTLDALDRANRWLYVDALYLPLRSSDLAKFSPGDTLVLRGTMHNYSGDSGYIPDPHDEIELARLSREGLRFGFVAALRAFDFKVVSPDETLDKLVWNSQRKLPPEDSKPRNTKPSSASSLAASAADIYGELDHRLKALKQAQHADCERICRDLTDKFKSRRLTMRFKVNQVLPGSDSNLRAAWIGVMSPPEGWQFMTTITTPEATAPYHKNDVLVISGNVRLSCFEFGSPIPGGTNNMVAQFNSDTVRHHFMLGVDSPSLRVEPK